MKRWTLIAMFAAAAMFAGCKKKGDAAATVAAPAPVEGTAAPAAGTPPAADPAAPAESEAAAAAPSDPPPSDAEVEAAGQKASKLIEALGEVVSSNAKDCAAMAPAIEKVIGEHQEFLADAKKWKGNAAAESKMEEWMKKNGVMEKVMQKMMPGMMACGQDPKVEAALKKMDL